MRAKYYEDSPEPVKIQRSLSAYLASSPLGKAMVELVYLRVSQINGCAYCLDMHSTALRGLQFDQRKMDVLAGWREAASLFDERERLALEIVEALVPVCRDGIPDELYARASKAFTPRDLTDLIFAVGLMSSWNRIAIAFHADLPNRKPSKAAAE